MFQKRLYLLLFVSLVFCSCATPVLQKRVMEQGIRNPNLADLTRDPSRYRGQLFIFGGIIASTTFTQQGCLVEAVYVPVDENGHLQEIPVPSQRFLALYPRSNGLLDPIIYHGGRRITVAGVFTEERKGKLSEMEYTYPFFEISELYLWPIKRRVYYVPEYYYPWHPWYGPWW
jgi:starvation-inducible outer membrane lipoprotein